MSEFNRKGFTQIPVGKTPEGKVVWAAVRIGSPAHTKYLRGFKKWTKQKQEHNRQFKAALRDRKKAAKELAP